MARKTNAVNRDSRGQVVVLVARALAPWGSCDFDHPARGVNPLSAPPGLFIVEWPDGTRRGACGFHLDTAVITGLPDG